MPSVIETGRAQPNGPRVEFPPEAEFELKIHEIDSKIVVDHLGKWWEHQLWRCRKFFVDSSGFSSAEVAIYLSKPAEHLEFATESAELKIAFSARPLPHHPTTIYSKGELEILLAHLQPTFVVTSLRCKSNALIRCSIYIDDPTGNPIAEQNIEAANQFITRFVESVGGEISELGDPRISSWFRDFVFRTKKRKTSEELADLFRDMRSAAEEQFLQKPAAEAENLRFEGAAELLKAIGENNAVVLLGRVLLVKRRSISGIADIVIRTLTENEVVFLKERDYLLYEPMQILEVLADFRSYDAGQQGTHEASHIPDSVQTLGQAAK